MLTIRKAQHVRTPIRSLLGESEKHMLEMPNDLSNSDENLLFLEFDESLLEISY